LLLPFSAVFGKICSSEVVNFHEQTITGPKAGSFVFTSHAD